MKNIHIDGFSDERWHKILKGVDLNLYRGEILGLIGESGAGKSTLGKAAMGYTQPGCKIIKGEIIFNGTDLAKLTEFEKEKFGVLKFHMLLNLQQHLLILHTD